MMLEELQHARESGASLDSRIARRRLWYVAFRFCGSLQKPGGGNTFGIFDGLENAEGNRNAGKGDKKLFEVGKSVGYDSDAAFSKAFKRVFGVAPREYQRNASGAS